MPYIGKQPLTGQFTKLTAISAGAGGLTDTYPLTDTLNELGEEGWELVGMSPLREKFDKAADDGCKEYEIEYVLKRQKDRWD